MKVFREEYSHAQKYLGDRKIYVHEMVPIIENRHKKEQQRRIKVVRLLKAVPQPCAIKS